MTWDGLVQPTGKYGSIRHLEYPEFKTEILGRMESTHYFPEWIDRIRIVSIGLELVCNRASCGGTH